MEFHDAANFLFGLRRYPPRPGLAATESLLDHLGDPHKDLTVVQVAGSNGKGSTARMTESVLREAGLDVGLYTSPHLDSVRERIRINGRRVTERALTEYVETVRPYILDRAATGASPTFFEAVTGLALWAFARNEVDVAVLEVGIGGRYDATSVTDPVASAVTSVTLEHTDVLGDTVEAIGRDLAHVAPADGRLVTAADGDALAGIEAQAGEVVRVGDSGAVEVSYGGRTGVESRVWLSGSDWRVETAVPLVGTHQADNAGVATVLARQVSSALDVDLPTETIERGLRTAHWPGRFEVMEREPLAVLDGAHNPGACERLAGTLDEFDYDDLHLVFGALADKDHRGMVEALPIPDSVVACRPDIDRAEDNAVLAAVVEDVTGLEVETTSDVTDALANALARADPDDCVLVCGSLYTVREARTRWSRLDVPKAVDDVADARQALREAHVTEPGVYRMRGKAVHRTLKTRVRPRQAQYLKEELLSLGGECAISGLNDQDEEFLDVLLMGTLAQFKRLTRKLDAQPYGLGPLADGISSALSLDDGDRDRGYPWDDRTAVMGILNVTPDSFHDGGEFETTERAVARAEEMMADDVDIVDVGGESTRPGADEVPVADECDRVVPVIERLADLDVMVSIDTRKAAVARAALDAGADIVNDVSGLADPEMRFVVAEYDCPVVVMHSIDAPVDPGTEVDYDDVVADTLRELRETVLVAERAGIDRENVIVDPGVGFGKDRRESFAMLGRLGEFRALGCPVLFGHSHKSMFDLVGRDADERLQATVAASAVAAERGADIVRVHDVAGTVAAVRVSEVASDPDTFTIE
ncbi:dihydropteroate synthase [Halococcus hamelinensis]|uniref:Probable bifunctional folylpolyglutamate synthase/dihydropteroate synthase n=1 Tax=Halococcus hamelinensis 100A6 TaxID=1132509 RepID=M0LXN2_9EURY|nr:dihydropteroate synthase [Halococcus hamelinensis]EMA37928.1 dihydropteroate synthase [Halococcus hamelinensis 100A6]